METITVEVNWETDGEVVSLPTIVEVPRDVDYEEISDWLSQKYGWLVEGWCYY